MKQKKQYVRPAVEIEYAYDLESELMYGNTLEGGGSTSGLITGSGGGGGSTGGGNLGGDDTDNSDRAKGSFSWGNLWEEEF